VWNATEQVSAKSTSAYGTAAKNAAEQPEKDAIALAGFNTRIATIVIPKKQKKKIIASLLINLENRNPKIPRRGANFAQTMDKHESNMNQI
jgi:hypothetical protein